MAVTDDRCRCVVPYCQHTTRRLDPDDQWICSAHWKLVPIWMKRRKTRLLRLWRKAGGRPDTPFPNGRARVAAYLWWKHWARIEKAAIERAVGITA